MNNTTLFYMWEQYRQHRISEHRFYMEQARKRLLSQFDNINQDADKAAEELLEGISQTLDPDRCDLGDYYEDAYHAANDFCLLLYEMRTGVLLTIAASIYHEWDKQVRKWMAREIREWAPGEHAKSALWRVDFTSIIDFWCHVGWNVRALPCYNTLNALRLVVNIYKHGEGTSFQELKQNFPGYLLYDSLAAPSDLTHLDHTDLHITPEHLQQFSSAILEFWHEIPERILSNENTVNVPDWFSKAAIKG